MRSFRDISIKHKLTLVIMLTSGVALLLACAAFLTYDVITFRRAMARDLMTLADIIADSSTAAITFYDRAAAEETLASLRAKPQITAACIYTANGEIFAKYFKQGEEQKALPFKPRMEEFHFAGDYLNLFRTITLRGENIGTVYIRSNVQEIYLRLRQYATIVFLVLLASSFTAFLLSSKTQRLISEPILYLARIARTISGEKNYSVRADKQGQDEVGELIDAFNEMLTQIQERDAALLDAHGTLEKRVEERTEELQQEITERKQVEEALRESEERYRILFEGSAHGILVADIETKRFVYANPSVCRMLGYTETELLQLGVADIHPKDSLSYVVSEFESQVRGEKALASAIPCLRKDGTVFYADITGTRTILGGRECNVGFFADITERKAAEEEIKKLNENLKKHTVELESVNTELEAFSYSVSHDLRAPLRSIDGFSQALLEDYTDVLDEQGKDYLQRVRAATQRMAQLIDDVLNLSRLTRVEMRRDTVDLSAMAETIATELRNTQPERQVEFIIAPGLITTGDPRLLRIVLENLLENAWKFTGMCSGTKIEFGITEYNDKPVFFVRDNGAGFDSAYADRLFVPFQRLHATTEFPGTGIGLAIVKRIIHRHGGQVWAEGAVGQGATFYFAF